MWKILTLWGSKALLKACKLSNVWPFWQCTASFVNSQNYQTLELTYFRQMLCRHHQLLP